VSSHLLTGDLANHYTPGVSFTVKEAAKLRVAGLLEIAVRAGEPVSRETVPIPTGVR
jgi:hypothetical protein